MRHLWNFILAGFLWLGLVGPAMGFSLRGPYAPWMDRQKGYQFHFDTGGPMDLGNEYRWNVPLVTYGFDESFVEALGEPGIQAVEEAFEVLNALPPASQINLEDFTLIPLFQNYEAYRNHILDLKSTTLTLVLQHLGLSNPTWFVYAIRDIQFEPTATNYTIIQRNFDPVSLAPSISINGTRFDHVPGYYSALDVHFLYISPMEMDSWPNMLPVAGHVPNYGDFFVSLSRDDMGGLAYLLKTNNLNVEGLLPGVVGAGTNADNYVTTALRPGVDKITFQRLHFDAVAKTFTPLTNVFTDLYVTNSEGRQQTLQRVITQPDILFKVKDFKPKIFRWNSNISAGFHPHEISGTSAWINNGTLNGSTEGPGVITPGAVITFHDYAPSYLASGRSTNDEMHFHTTVWGSYSGSTNPPVVFLGNRTQLDSLSLQTSFTATNGFEWIVLANLNAVYQVERSTNLTQWEAVSLVTNSTGLITVTDTNLTDRKFYRVVKQP